MTDEVVDGQVSGWDRIWIGLTDGQTDGYVNGMNGWTDEDESDGRMNE